MQSFHPWFTETQKMDFEIHYQGPLDRTLLWGRSLLEIQKTLKLWGLTPDRWTFGSVKILPRPGVPGEYHSQCRVQICPSAPWDSQALLEKLQGSFPEVRIEAGHSKKQPA